MFGRTHIMRGTKSFVFSGCQIIDDDLSAVRANGAQTLDSPIAQLVRAPH